MLFMEFSIHALTLNIDDNSSTNTKGVYDILIWFVSTSNVWASLLASLLSSIGRLHREQRDAAIN